MREGYNLSDQLSIESGNANEAVLPGTIRTNSSHLRDLSIEVLACSKCPELVRSRTLPVCGFGSPNPDILLVGEAPGRFGADVYGIPFSGDRSGTLLQKMLRTVGFSESDPSAVIPKLNNVYLTNLVRCNPRSTKGNNRAPTKEEVSNCSDFLWREIHLLRPKVIATLGRHTTEVVVGRHINEFRYARPMQENGFVIFPLHHPGFVIRGGGTQRLGEVLYQREFWMLKSLTDELGTLPDSIAPLGT